jgi:hypothetical protein
MRLFLGAAIAVCLIRRSCSHETTSIADEQLTVKQQQRRAFVLGSAPSSPFQATAVVAVLPTSTTPTAHTGVKPTSPGATEAKTTPKTTAAATTPTEQPSATPAEVVVVNVGNGLSPSIAVLQAIPVQLPSNKQATGIQTKTNSKTSNPTTIVTANTGGLPAASSHSPSKVSSTAAATTTAPLPTPVDQQYNRANVIFTTCNNATVAERTRRIQRKVQKLTNATILQDSTSAPFAALQWLNHLDSAILCDDDPQLLQRYTLAVLYFATNGQNWSNCTADLTTTNTAVHTSLGACQGGSRFLDAVSECFWYGVTCTVDNQVETIRLKANGLSGQLPIELFLLPDLTGLSLDHNKNITGTIPASLSKAHNLTYIELDDNALTGSFPAAFYKLTGLKAIDLDNNLLTGTISSDIRNLKLLMVLQLENNWFQGPLPNFAPLSNMSTFVVMSSCCACEHKTTVLTLTRAFVFTCTVQSCSLCTATPLRERFNPCVHWSRNEEQPTPPIFNSSVPTVLLPFRAIVVPSAFKICHRLSKVEPFSHVCHVSVKCTVLK